MAASVAKDRLPSLTTRLLQESSASASTIQARVERPPFLALHYLRLLLVPLEVVVGVAQVSLPVTSARSYYVDSRWPWVSQPPVVEAEVFKSWSLIVGNSDSDAYTLLYHRCAVIKVFECPCLSCCSE